MILYKKDSKGKIRVLELTHQEDVVTQSSGLLDGKKVVHTYVATPKNVGKANETTGPEQAKSEVESKITEKLKEGYSTTMEIEEIILPMLAHTYSKKSKIDFPCFVQPKLDGMRAITPGQKLISRKNTPITTVKHIEDDISKIRYILDGELYAEGYTFQENMTRIKKYQEGLTEEIKYHVYDLILPGREFSDRYSLLLEVTVSSHPNIIVVPTYMANSENDIKNYHKQFLAEGYEGTIIRHGKTGYEINKRSHSLLKYKDFLDIDAEIVDIEPSKKDPEKGIVVCKIPAGEFGCGMKVTHDMRKEMLANKENYIGKTANIRFFEYTDGGLPRFPVFIGIHNDR